MAIAVRASYHLGAIMRFEREAAELLGHLEGVSSDDKRIRIVAGYLNSLVGDEVAAAEAEANATATEFAARVEALRSQYGSAETTTAPRSTYGIRPHIEHTQAELDRMREVAEYFSKKWENEQ